MRSLVLFGAALLTSCVDADAAVFVDASVSNPSVTAMGSSLVTVLEGGFRLGLHLGPRASGSSSVSLGKFALTNADRSLTLVDPLDVTTSTTFPVTVEVDSDVTVDFTIATDDAPADTLSAVCGASGLRITGSIQDSLQDGLTPLASDIFYPTCNK